jgi:glutamate dehydrogenase/leucine dehydrogenase
LSIFDSQDFADHDQVSFCRDRSSGLFAIIAIHDVSLGPAVGGCRMWPYACEEEAIRDALRLSRGMTYKNAMAELPHGGGKSVILGDPRRDKSEALLRAFGRFVESLGGRYVAAPDVGMSVHDMDIMSGETRYVAGVSNQSRASGDPSPFTAHGVLAALRVAVEHRLQRSSLEGLRVALQGVGSTGMQLCQLLHEQGAALVVADVNPQAAAEAVARFGARAVRPEDIHAEDVDVFAPCALGAVLNDESVAVGAARCAVRTGLRGQRRRDHQRGGRDRRHLRPGRGVEARREDRSAAARHSLRGADQGRGSIPRGRRHGPREARGGAGCGPPGRRPLRERRGAPGAGRPAHPSEGIR